MNFEEELLQLAFAVAEMRRLQAQGIGRQPTSPTEALRAAERKVDDLLALALMPTFLPFVPAYVGDKS